MEDDEQELQQPEGGEEQETEQPAPEGEEMAEGGASGAEGEAGTGPGKPNVSPEQQAQYARFVDNGLHIIFNGGKPDPETVNLLKSGDPIHAVAQATVNVVMACVTSAKGKGVQLDPAVILKGAQEIYQNLCDLSTKLKIHNFTPSDVDKGWVLTMQLGQQQMQAAGLIDPKAFVRDIQEMNRAEQEGRVDEVLPGVGKLVSEVNAARQKGGGSEEAPPPEEGEDEEQGFKGFGG